jgi:hypothetical protein
MESTRTKRIGKLVFIVIMLALMSNIVLAMGVGPSRQHITFAPGQEIQGELMIVNDKGEEFRAAIYPQGDLTEYITVEPPLVDVSSGEYIKRVRYTIKFPVDAPTPGTHKLELVVRQFPPDTELDEGTVISANLALISQILVKVPYPGKYAEGKLFVSGSEKMDTPTKFVVQLFNFGTADIDKAHARIQVFNPSMEKVAEIYTNNMSVRSKAEARLQAVWNPDVNKGEYKAIVTVYFDEKEFTLEQGFALGTFAIDVSDISVEKFRLGDVAKFDILLFNSWNTEMKDVYVEMVVEDSIGNKMTEFKTAAVDIPANQGEELEAYWYTEGVAPGIYTVKLIVHYAGKITQKEYDFEVNTNSIKKLGAVGQAITAAEEEEVKTTGLLIILIVLVLVMLIGMNIVWFYFLSRKFKGKGEEK